MMRFIFESDIPSWSISDVLKARLDRWVSAGLNAVILQVDDGHGATWQTDAWGADPRIRLPGCSMPIIDSKHNALDTTLSTTLAGEDVTNGVLKVEERYLTIPVGGTDAMISADQLYKSGTGYVRSITCYSDATATAGQDVAMCGSCGLVWDDAIPTSWTPAPSGRCPFEYYHKQAKVK